MKLLPLPTIALMLAVAPALAQITAPAKPMPPMTMPKMDMTMPGMTSSIDLNDPMSREASGTAWLPDSSPTYAAMTMKPNGDMLMLHGVVTPRYTNVSSKRGDRRFDAPNWFMGMYSHPINAQSQIGLRAMISLDPITEGGYGYPLLFQTGETWHHQPLHDRQHPHDLFDELSATYSHRISRHDSVYFYAADPGEPALGPPTYMHRLLAYDYPDAPIGHHWQDATHITFGVATAGFNLGDKVKLEASDFTGREPNEDRYNFDKPRFDSYSSRLSYNPDADNAYQVSYGYVKNAEGDGVEQHRITASWLYDKPLGDDANFTTALVWGQNNLTTEGRSNSYLAEADFQRGANTLFGRIENIQKSGHELVLEDYLGGTLTDRKYTLGAYTAGYVRDLTHGKGIDTGLGAAVTVNTKPSALDAAYGSGTPISFEIYLRFRPSRLKMGSMTGMSSMKEMAMPLPEAPANPPAPNTGGVRQEPTGAVLAPPNADNEQGGVKEQGTASSASPVPAPVTVTAALTPAAPKARVKNRLTVTLTDSSGKPVVGAKINASVAMTSMDMGTTHPKFTDNGNGSYTGTVQFAMAGPWRITLQITPPKVGPMVTQTLDYGVGD